MGQGARMPLIRVDCLRTGLNGGDSPLTQKPFERKLRVKSLSLALAWADQKVRMETTNV